MALALEEDLLEVFTTVVDVEVEREEDPFLDEPHDTTKAASKRNRSFRIINEAFC